MRTPRLTPEQAAKVDDELARQAAYLQRLVLRLRECGAKDHYIMGWAEKAEWSVGALKIHFAKWAEGDDGQWIQPPTVPQL